MLVALLSELVMTLQELQKLDELQQKEAAADKPHIAAEPPLALYTEKVGLTKHQ